MEVTRVVFPAPERSTSHKSTGTTNSSPRKTLASIGNLSSTPKKAVSVLAKGERNAKGSSSMPSTTVVPAVVEDGDKRDVVLNASMTESERRRQSAGEDMILQSENESEDEAEEESFKPPLHVEVRLRNTACIRFDVIRQIMHQHLLNDYEELPLDTVVEEWKNVQLLSNTVDRVVIAECGQTSQNSAFVSLSDVELHIHIYQPIDQSQEPEAMIDLGSSQPDDGQEDDADNVMAATVVELPASNLEGVWDNLMYDGDIKNRLLNYIYSTILFSDAKVDFNVITWHRVVLLHGPPGTGKTSLCRALAQKLSIRLSDRYNSSRLVEINAHSLFSKWFSESGKLVQRLFTRVLELADEPSVFVTVLIDEVESLTAARAGAMAGREPSDALRVVNALLTQLDKLKTRPNVLVLTTSNLPASIDGAFVDRADIKFLVPLPPCQAVYAILKSCLEELMRSLIIKPCRILEWKSVQLFCPTGTSANDFPERSKEGSTLRASATLRRVSEECHKQSMSGRTLRRLPVLAHARYLSLGAKAGARLEVRYWLDAMLKIVADDAREMSRIVGGQTIEL